MVDYEYKQQCNELIKEYRIVQSDLAMAKVLADSLTVSNDTDQYMLDGIRTALDVCLTKVKDTTDILQIRNLLTPYKINNQEGSPS